MMARKRMVDPSFWTDEKLGECTITQRLLFMGLISNADDEGYGRANPKIVKATIFPYDEIEASDIEKWMLKLHNMKLIILYKSDNQSYYYLPNFKKHQTINKAKASTFPKHDDDGAVIVPYEYGNGTVVVPYEYGNDTVGLPPKRKEEKGREEKRIEVCMHGANDAPCPPSADDEIPFTDIQDDEEELIETEQPIQKEQPVITLTLNDKSEYPVTQSQIDEWTSLYPAVDVMQELRKMKGWLSANPSRRKTKRGILRFINSWLAGEQDKGKMGRGTMFKKTNAHYSGQRNDNYDDVFMDLESV